MGFPGHLLFKWISLLFGFVQEGLDFGRVFVEIILFHRAPFRGFDAVDLRANLASLFLPERMTLAMALHFFFRYQGDIITSGRVGKECLQPIIVGLQNRIVFMIVTAGAAVGQASEHGANCVSDIVQNLLPPLHQIAGVAFVRVMTIERSGDQRIRIVRPELVSGDLLADEAIVGLVVIQ